MTAKFLSAAFRAAAFRKGLPGRELARRSGGCRNIGMDDVDVPLCGLAAMPATVLPTAGDARRPYRAYTNLAHRDAHREPQAYGDACVSRSPGRGRRAHRASMRVSDPVPAVHAP
jgi:hypothetical protein